MTRLDDRATTTGIGARIRAIRLSRGMTQEVLAQRMGTRPARISALETGIRRPSAATCIALAQALGCSTDDILLG